jgi:hypothetical protein
VLSCSQPSSEELIATINKSQQDVDDLKIVKKDKMKQKKKTVKKFTRGSLKSRSNSAYTRIPVKCPRSNVKKSSSLETNVVCPKATSNDYSVLAEQINEIKDEDFWNLSENVNRDLIDKIEPLEFRPLKTAHSVSPDMYAPLNKVDEKMETDNNQFDDVHNERV